MALLVTGISGTVAVVAGTTTWIVEQSADPMHPLGNAGWLAFPAGFVAVGGLIAFLGDVLLASTARPAARQAAQAVPGGARRPVGALRAAVLAYATVLFVGALGAIAFTIHDRGGMGVGPDVFVFLCAAAFLWGVMRLRRPAASRGQVVGLEAGPGRGPGGGGQPRVVRQWGLAFTGVGAGLAVALYWYMAFINHFFWSGVLFGPVIFLGLAFLVAAGGLVLLVVDGLLRLTGRRS